MANLNGDKYKIQQFEVRCKFYAENKDEFVENFIVRCINHYYGFSYFRKWSNEESDEKLKLLRKYLPSLVNYVVNKDLATSYKKKYDKNIRLKKNIDSNFKNLSHEEEKYLVKLKTFEIRCEKMSSDNVKPYIQTKFIANFRRAYADCYNNTHWSDKEKEDLLKIFGIYFPNLVEGIKQYAKNEKIMRAQKEMYKKERLDKDKCVCPPYVEKLQ